MRITSSREFVNSCRIDVNYDQRSCTAGEFTSGDQSWDYFIYSDACVVCLRDHFIFSYWIKAIRCKAADRRFDDHLIFVAWNSCD